MITNPLATVFGVVIDRRPWLGLIYMLLAFPFGVGAFVFVVTTFTVGGALLAAPVYYSWSPPNLGWWVADTLPEALLCSLVGALLLIVSLHVVKGIAWLWGRLSEIMLTKGF